MSNREKGPKKHTDAPNNDIGYSHERVLATENRASGKDYRLCAVILSDRESYMICKRCIQNTSKNGMK